MVYKLVVKLNGTKITSDREFDSVRDAKEHFRKAKLPNMTIAGIYVKHEPWGTAVHFCAFLTVVLVVATSIYFLRSGV